MGPLRAQARRSRTGEYPCCVLTRPPVPRSLLAPRDRAGGRVDALRRSRHPAALSSQRVFITRRAGSQRNCVATCIARVDAVSHFRDSKISGELLKIPILKSYPAEWFCIVRTCNYFCFLYCDAINSAARIGIGRRVLRSDRNHGLSPLRQGARGMRVRTSVGQACASKKCAFD
ncbi:hypothetical protein BLAT2472_80306 [Burkholderia latens]